MPRASSIAVGSAVVLAVGLCSGLVVLATASSPTGDPRVTSRPLLALLADPPPTRNIPYLTQNGELAAKGKMDLAGARVAATSPTGSDLLAVPTNAGAMICVIATFPAHPRAGGGACATRDQFKAGGVFAILADKDHPEVIGLLPDGVATVEATDAYGHHTRVSVRKNAIRLPHAEANIVTFYIGMERVVQDLTHIPTNI